MNEDELREFYSRVAAGYDQVVAKMGYFAHLQLPERLIELHSADRKRKRPTRVLDLACGTGLGAELFFEVGYEVTGVDYSPGMLEVAKLRPYKQLLCHSIEDDLPLPNASFDIVTAIGVTEFITAPARLFDRIWNKLVNKGLCALTVPKPSPESAKLGIFSYTVKDFLKFVEPQKFELIEIMEFFGYESGHLAAIDGEDSQVHHRIDYSAVFLRKV